MIGKLLVPLDGSGFGEETLPYAAAIARYADAAVDVVYVCIPESQEPAFGHDPHDFDDSALAERRAYLASIAEGFEEASGREAHPVLLTGIVADAIEAHVVGADGPGLIVMSTHGRTGLSRAWLGSVADALIRRSPWPIVLVRPREGREGEPERRLCRPFRKIFVPLDGSPRSERALGPALTLASSMGCSVKLFRVVSSLWRGSPGQGGEVETARRAATEYLEGVAEGLPPVDIEVEVVDDPQPALAILEAVDRGRADLVALTTHGRRGVRRMVLGSVADKVLRGSDVPMLVLGPGVE
jgi:nucleotide-binding universal stress UspA family protein